ncbi:MAG TPA: VOC family protein [Actinomycetota bacterium]|nr:VOC family protein [Actinomycetota bacterium]
MSGAGGDARRGIHHLLLQTSDLDKAEAFYLGFLGFGVKKREEFRDGRPLTVTTEGLGLTSGVSGEAGSVVEHIAFRTSDIRGIAERAAAEGIEVVRELGPGPYGLTVYLADPDGNTIELFSEDEV